MRLIHFDGIVCGVARLVGPRRRFPGLRGMPRHDAVSEDLLLPNEAMTLLLDRDLRVGIAVVALDQSLQAYQESSTHTAA